MADTLLLFAVLCGLAGAWKRKRSSIALLASVATTSAFVALDVPFDWRLWGAIDLAVILAIVSGKMTVGEWLVLPLFIPAWVTYAEPHALAHDVTTILVSLQLLLTFPAQSAGQILRRLAARWKANFQHRDEWTDLERAQRG